MFAAEDSDFGAETGELLVKTFVADEKGNVDGNYRLIRLKDRWMLV